MQNSQESLFHWCAKLKMVRSPCAGFDNQQLAELLFGGATPRAKIFGTYQPTLKPETSQRPHIRRMVSHMYSLQKQVLLI